MRILQVNKFFYDRGGSSRYFFEVSRLLKNRGHQIRYFSVKNRFNRKSIYSKYFAEEVSFHNFNIFRLPKFVGRLSYSSECNDKLNQLLERYPADIAHLHNIYHQIS